MQDHEIEGNNNYEIHAVISHIGGVNKGHYIAYIKSGDEWYEYNDIKVTKVNEKESIEQNYGGTNHLSKSAYFNIQKIE